MKIDLEKKFLQDIFELIKRVGELADKNGTAVYIVGGIVRDIFLNIDMANYDLDFVVEGDGIHFAEVLNEKLKGTLKTYRAFKTATIDYGAVRIDIVTARSETYEKPAMYPNVKPGTIKDDLFRRDFTINAIAICVNKRCFGEVVDFYDGRRDLKKGIIRVMHNRSFIDDPTRIFRAIRFAVRFGFKIDPDTKKLIKKAVLDGLLGEVNRGRIKKEIELFLKEKDSLKCLDEFARLV